jgi:phthalate 4,5-dioxygenase oxygenase subunit
MTTAAEGELLTRTGPGTSLGSLMREYWIPAAMSSELKPDGDPMRLMLLGEKLIAFRDSLGRVGIMDHRCPHRGASLFFGRNEKEGISCAYHGWKFGVEGNCLAMPNVPSHQSFTDKIKAKAYPAVERNGLIWTYMGARKEPPPLPCFELVILPETERRMFFVQRECSWLQALEGDLDTSHLGFLHQGSIDPTDADPTNNGRFALINRAPEYHVADTDWGTMYCAHRPADAGNTYLRFAHFMFPFWTIPPDGDFSNHIVTRAWVPMDDEHMMFVHLSWNDTTPGLRKMKDGSPMPGMGIGQKFLPNDTSWHGRWRLAANASNDYLIDRDAQRRNQIYTGIEASICRIRQSPKAWVRSSTIRSSISRSATS